jgi:hypothetical protein
MPISAQLTLLPPWLAVLILVSFMVAASIIGFLIVHRFIPVKIRQIHNDVAGFVFATVGVAYGVLLGFLVLVVWVQFDKVQANVGDESSVVLLLAGNINAYPDQQKSRLMKEALLEYAGLALEEHEQVVARARSAANYDAEITSSVGKLLNIAEKVIAQGHRDAILDSAILANLNELVKYRNLRLQAAERDLPSAIWLAVVAGAMITIGFTFLFGTENVWAHITMISMLTALIAVVIYVVIEIEYPFLGYTVVAPPEGYRILLAKAHSP